MISATGGSHGLRDLGLVESALLNANATFNGQELYPDQASKAAAVCFSNQQPSIY